jgi:2TM domain
MITNPTYSQEDIQEILSIALAERSTLDTDLPHSQLLEIAQELGISTETIEVAKDQWLSQQQAIKQHQEFNRYRQSKQQDRFSKYAIVNSCLIPLNFFTGFGVPWSLYVLASWGIVRGVSAWRVFFQRQGYGYDRAFEKWEYQQKM